MTLQEILDFVATGEPSQVITALKEKSVHVPAWSDGVKGLRAEYDPRLHPVMDKARYPDIVTDGGRVKVSRIALDFQRLAVKRMSELCCGIPVRREYRAEGDRQKQIAKYIESIYDAVCIDDINAERLNMLFAGCEVMTMWYAVEQPHVLYGFDAPLKLRCRNFTPMIGDELWPLFDEYGDMVAMSIGYQRKVGQNTVSYFECYTAERHLKWSSEGGTWAIVTDERITLGKIPAIYMWRPTPIWEQTSTVVEDMEWALSRNGNYIRENSKPLLAVFADEVIEYGKEKSPNKEFRQVAQFPQDAKLEYVTWQGATENLKYHVETLRSMFFTLLQLPDWSYEKMSQQALSGESRKQMFIDAQLKVRDESGRIVKFLRRETNVIKAFLKAMLPEDWAADIDALAVESKITPFMIADEAERITNLMNANGGEPIISQRESIQMYGHSKDVDRTLQEIQAQQSQKMDIFQQEPTE